MKQTMHVGDNKFLITYIVTVLLFYTSGVCIAIVYQEIGEINPESGTDIRSTQMEIVFFTVDWNCMYSHWYLDTQELEE